MLKRIDYKSNKMVGDQTYPAFELRNILWFIRAHLGADAAQALCQQIAVNELQLANGQFVFVWQVEHAMEFLRLHSQDANIGFRLGLSYRVASLDELLPHLAELPDLLACLQFVANHPRLVGSFSDTLICMEENHACIRWLNTGKMVPQKYAFQFLHSVGSLLGFARQLTGQAVCLSQILLAEEQRDVAFLAQESGASIHFSQDYFEWRIATSWLSAPITYAFSPLPIVESLPIEPSLVELVLAQIHAQFPHVPNLDSMAELVHMSSRNFRRKLAFLGSSYQQLVDQVRCQKAISLLLEGDVSIDYIAERLGFSDVSHFRQSFKHWLGYPPGHFCRLNHMLGNVERVSS